MADPKIPSDDSASLAGTIHQMYIALEQCLEMDGKDQCVVIEKLGDVTSTSPDGNINTEVKSYSKSDPLTDRHPNFWNTMKNWLAPDPRIANMRCLVLYTTQPFGATAGLARWNEMAENQRLHFLENLKKVAEEEFEAALAKTPDHKSSQTLKDIRHVLDTSRRSALLKLLPKVTISADVPGLSECRDRIVGKSGKFVPEQNASDFIGALFEIVVKPATIEKQWTIEYQAFSEHVSRFTKYFHGGKCAFPDKYKAKRSKVGKGIPPEHQDSEFVEKIKEINFHSKIPSAVADYIHATMTWTKEFSAHECLRQDYEFFADDVKDIFQTKHELASRESNGEISDSQNFYLKVTSDAIVPSFPKFETPDHAYRNGVIHVLMDTDQNICWRLSHEA